LSVTWYASLAMSSAQHYTIVCVMFEQHELKLDSPIQKHVVSTLRCFERALQLDDANGKLWIEYGSCAYLIHSHASRLLKQVPYRCHLTS